MAEPLPPNLRGATASPARTPTVRCTESALLFVLLAIVALRPLISESYDSGQTIIGSAEADLDETATSVTLYFDLAILACAAIWLALRTVTTLAYCKCGIEWGAALLAIAGVISCLAARQQRLAINATFDWLALPVLTVLLVQLLRTRRQLVIALGVVCASAATQALEAYSQVYVYYPETKQLYEQSKDQYWAQRGVPLDSPQVALYEARLAANEAGGYLDHANVAGAYLLLTGLIALAVACGRFARPPQRGYGVFAAVVATFVLSAVRLTGSMGAMLAGAIAAGVAFVRWGLRHWIDCHRRRALWLGWGLVCGGLVAVIGHGMYHGGLPGASLNFRWQYWDTSAGLIADYWKTGVGRENFGRHYLQYKTIDSPEEVTNPHNFLVQALAEWGVIGLLAVAAMLVGGSIAVTSRVCSGPPMAELVSSRSLLGWGLGIGVAVFFVRLFLLGSDNADYLLVVTAMPAVAWALGFALTTAALRDGVNWTVVTIGINCALLAFLVQDLINFALFIPGSATTFFALLAMPMAASVQDRETKDASITQTAVPKTGIRRWLLPAAAGLVVITSGIGLVWPVARSGKHLLEARDAATSITPGGLDNQPAYRRYLAAADADLLDPTPFAEGAGWVLSFASLSPDGAAALAEADQMAAQAIQRDPLSTSLHRLAMRVALAAQASTGDPTFLHHAVTAARNVTRLYPQSPSAHADLGARLLEAAEATGQAELYREAAAELERALELDEARPEWEVLRRFSPRRKAEIEAQRQYALAGVSAEAAP